MKFRLIFIILIFIVSGLVFLYSASAIYAQKRFNDETYFLKKQTAWAVIGIATLLLISRVNYTIFYKFANLIIAGSVLLLVLPLIPGIGVEVNGARRWIRIFGLGFQPSEFARLALIIFLSAFVAEFPERIKDFRKGFLPCFGITALVCMMIAIEPDIGMAFLTATVATILLVVMEVRLKHILPTFAGCLLILAIFALTTQKYVLARVAAFISSDQTMPAMYQLKQSLIAIGSGGIFGEGLGNSLQKLFYLPEPHSDFILSIAGEELGFVGMVAILGLFFILFLNLINICKNVSNKFAFFLVYGLTINIILQVIINTAVVLGCLPTKGIPLPFLSYGGSNLLSNCIAIGIVAGIANLHACGTSDSQKVEPVSEHNLKGAYNI